MKKERLDKLLAARGPWSRKDIRTLTSRGLVTLDGAPCLRADTKVDPETACVTVQGKEISLQWHIYIMLHKPTGVVSATKDDLRPTVVDLVPPHLQRKGLFPAGRLDKDTTGFVLITDDGDFAHRILSPGRHVPKTYQVTVDRALTQELISTFAAGVTLESGEVCLPAEIEILSPLSAQVILHQGMYHQIKRMFAAFGYTVTALHRSAMGGLELDPDLEPGQCRELANPEVRMIEGQAE